MEPNNKIGQMKCFGHLIRLPDDTPAKPALKHLNEQAERLQGRQRTTWKQKLIKKKWKG